MPVPVRVAVPVSVKVAGVCVRVETEGPSVTDRLRERVNPDAEDGVAE